MSKKPFTTPSFPTSLLDLQAFPSPYEYVLLSKHVYQDNIQEGDQVEVIVKDEKITLEGWSVHRVFNEATKRGTVWQFFAPTDGYKAVLYTHTKKKKMVLAYKGLQYRYFRDIKLALMTFFKNDSKELPFIFEFVKRAIGETTCGYTLSFTGHSLGGFLAQISTFLASKDYLTHSSVHRHFKGFTFDAPGSRDILETIDNRYKPTDIDCLDITNYLCSPNIFNACNRHVGSNYRVVFESFSDMSLWDYTLNSHAIDHFVEAFDRQTHRVRKCACVLDWPLLDKAHIKTMLSKIVTKDALELGFNLCMLLKESITGEIFGEELQGFFAFAMASDTLEPVENHYHESSSEQRFVYKYCIEPFDSRCFHRRHIPENARKLIKSLTNGTAREKENCPSFPESLRHLRQKENEHFFLLEDGTDARLLLDYLALLPVEELEGWYETIVELLAMKAHSKCTKGLSTTNLSLEEAIEQLQKEAAQEVDQDRIARIGLELYVPLKGSLSLILNPDEVSETTLFDLDEHVDKFLHDVDQRLLLLQGNSGAGKSLYGRYLERSLWKKRKKANDPIPLFISLSHIYEGERDIIRKTLTKKLGKDAEEIISALRRQRIPLILILDGFDDVREMYQKSKGPTHFLKHFLLDEWRCKCIVSCRSQVLRDEDKRYVFGINGEPIQPLYVVPFKSGQIKSYVKYFASKNASNKLKLWDQARYQEALDQFSGLREMVRTPLSLNLILNVLPKLTVKDQVATSISRAQVYQVFSDQWFQYEINRLGQIKKFSKNPKKLKEKLERYCGALAFEMLMQNTQTLTEEDEIDNEDIDMSDAQCHRLREIQRERPHFFKKNNKRKDEVWRLFLEDEEALLCLNRSPLQRVGENQFAFLHKSFQEYFAARHIVKNLFEMDRPNYRRQCTFQEWFENLCSVYQEEARASALSTIKERRAYEISCPPLNQKLLHSQPAIIHFIVDILHDEKKAANLPTFFFEIIEASKKNKDVVIASANAITILNAAGFSFAEKAWAGIRIPGANLDHAMLSHANLQGAELMGVSMRMAYLEGANLQDAELMDVNFGEYPYLEHPEEVDSVSWSHRHDLLATSSNKDIYIWDPLKAKKLRILSGHEREIQRVKWSYNDELIASASADNSVRIWDASSGKLLHLLHHGDFVSSISWSHDSQYLASAGRDGNIRVWDTKHGKQVNILQGDKKSMDNIHWSHNGRFIASVDNAIQGEEKIYVWDDALTQKICVLEGHDDTILSVHWSHSDEFLVSGSAERTVRLWDAKTGKPLRVLLGDMIEVCSVRWSHDDLFIASAGFDGTVRVWDSRTGQVSACLLR